MSGLYVIANQHGPGETGRSPRTGISVTGLLLLCACSHSADAIARDNTRAIDVFEKTVRPLLVKHCYECHGPQAGAGESGLRLDSLSSILNGGESGPAVVPGKPDLSLLIHAVNHEPTVTAMPPDKRLARAEIAQLIDWVSLKAPWPVAGLDLKLQRPRVAELGITDDDRRFWAFQPVRASRLPRVRNRLWVRNPIDQFVLSRLEAPGLTPAEPADRRTLIRRATFDLHGLPPTPDEVADFAQDDSPDAFERLVHRLLDSPRYGEKWGRHWLDVARYSDSNGMDDNIAFADAWRYRDYVIAAFNQDAPYDQFVREQVAGDLLTTWNSPRRADAVVATTFLMLGQKQPSADDPVKQQLDIVDEQLDTLTRAFLAMTVACARCHDHKFDPYSQRDYYALAGILRSTTSMLSFRVDAKFNVTALTSQADNAVVSRFEQQMDQHDDVLVNGNKLDMTVELRKSHTNELSAAYEKMSAIPTAMAVEDGAVADMPVLLRGNHLTPADLVPRGVPRILAGSHPFSVAAGASGRRELAEWLVSPDNPLTPRVMVNRIWQWHMGMGIVASVDNFGRLGQRPQHPELLDWLAIRFVESGWSMKAMHRLIMCSSTYRMSSRDNQAARQVDPENRLLWRMPLRRLQAEELRDSLLLVSEQLDSKMGGRTLPIRNHKIMSGNEISKCNAVHQQPRRTVYLPVIRSGLHEFLTTFDFPDPSLLAGRRHVTIVAPQALYMMNAPLIDTSAQRVARLLMKSRGA
ncbi:MAG: PSD1 and planctomycete cytochrome C domain-containing protein, partial [Planctomycetaceae bacterium]